MQHLKIISLWEMVSVFLKGTASLYFWFQMCVLTKFLSVVGGPLDLMSCRVVAAGTQEMATFIAQEIQTIHYTRDDENWLDLSVSWKLHGSSLLNYFTFFKMGFLWGKWFKSVRLYNLYSKSILKRFYLHYRKVKGNF